jgi:hypothetical protein
MCGDFGKLIVGLVVLGILSSMVGHLLLLALGDFIRGRRDSSG